jgi:hypothetical protein
MQDQSGWTATQKWNFYRNMLGKIPIYRKFSSGAISKWNNDGDLQEVLATPSCRRVLQSFKGAGTDSVTGNKKWTQSDLDTYWSQSNFPSESSGIIIYLSWFHEPNGNWDGATATAQYRTLTRQFCDYVHANAPSNVKTVGPIWASGNIIYDNNGEFVDWFPGVDSSGVPYHDYVGIDLYSRPFRSTSQDAALGFDGYLRWPELLGNTTIGADPDSFWAALDAGQLPCRSGRWMIGEIASTNVRDPVVSGTYNPADDDDSRRGAWARYLYTELGTYRDDCEAVCWWSSVDNGDYRYWTWAGTQADPLSDPLAVAWRQNCMDSADALGW